MRSHATRAVLVSLPIVFLLGACGGDKIAGTIAPVSAPAAVSSAALTPSALPSATAVSLASASALASPSPVAVASASAPAPRGPQPLKVGTLPPGEYHTVNFQPTLGFTVPDAGWREVFPEDADEIDIASKQVDLGITRPPKVVDPSSGKVIDTPDDMAKWLANHPTLRASAPVPVTVAGIPSTIVDSAGPAKTTDIFAYPTGNMRAPANSPTRFIVVPMDGPDLILVIGPPETGGTLEEAITAAQPIVDSLSIEP